MYGTNTINGLIVSGRGRIMFGIINIVGVLVLGSLCMAAESDDYAVTTCDYEVPGYMTDFGRPLRTLSKEDLYHDDPKKVLEALGPRNLSYLRTDASHYDDNKPDTTLSIERELYSAEAKVESGQITPSPDPNSYDSGESRSIDAKFSIPLISIWPGWTPFTFDFPTPGELAMQWTPDPLSIEETDIDESPNMELKWDHLIHTPKMIVIDFDYTLTNCSTDEMFAPLEPYDKFPAAVDAQGYLFVAFHDIERILRAVRAKGMKTALIAKERRPELVTQFLHCNKLDKLFDHVELYHQDDEDDTIVYLKTLSAKSKVPIRDMIYFDENFQSLKDAFKLGATPQRCYTKGLTMIQLNRCLDQHNQFNIHGVLSQKLFTATGIPGFNKEEFENDNPIFMTTMSAKEYQQEYEKHIAALNKKLRSGHPPFPRWTKWRH